jgi:hypothetical protein
MRDQFAPLASWDRGLVHVKGAGKCRLHLLQLQIGVGQKNGMVLLPQLLKVLLIASDCWEGRAGGNGGHGKPGWSERGIGAAAA